LKFEKKLESLRIRVSFSFN